MGIYCYEVFPWFPHSDFISAEYLENELMEWEWIRLNFAYALTLIRYRLA